MFRRILKQLNVARSVFVDIILGGRTPTVSEARRWLNYVSQNPNNSCYTDRPFTYEKPEYELSIVIPVYNGEKWIKNAVDSVLNQQTKFSFEVIVINDGSTDRTGDILTTYSDYKQIKVINQKNKGFSGARNTGITENCGKYIMFVDSDDRLLPDAIEKLMSCAFEMNADVVAGNFRYEYSNGKSRDVVRYKYEEVIPLGNLHGQPWGKVYRRNMFEHLEFPEGYWFEDSIFAQIMWPMCKKCYTIPQIVYGYYINQAGITNTAAGKPKTLDSYYITEKLLDDKQRFALEISPLDYQYYVRMLKLTYRRTRLLNFKTRQSIFVLQCELRDKYFSNFDGIAKETNLEHSLISKDYRRFVIAVNI